MQLYSGVVNAEHEGPAGRDVAEQAPWQVRAAGAVVGSEALAGLVFAAALGVRAATAGVPIGPVIGQSGSFLLLGVALAAVARGLLIGRHWARTPAIVTQLLLLPVAYSVIGPSRQPLIGTVVAVLVAGCFLLLISEAARAWWAAE